MNRTTQILAVMFVLVAGFFLWSVLSKDPEVATLTATTINTDTSVGDAKTLETLANMKNIRLDGRIFEDPAFQALINTERQIVREPVGRPNPFAPVGSDDTAVQQTVDTSTGSNPQPQPDFAE